MPVGPIAPATKRGRSRVANSSQALRASSAASRLISTRTFAQAVFVEFQSRAHERVGLDDVGTGGEVGAVNVVHDARARQHECLVASVAARAAEVAGREIERHELRAHGAVEDEHPLPEQAQIIRQRFLSYRASSARVTATRISPTARPARLYTTGRAKRASFIPGSSIAPSRRSAAIVEGPRARPAPSSTFAA